MRAASVVALAAIAFALAACAGEDEEETQPPAATTEQTTTEVALPEVEGIPPTTGSLAGTWTLFGESLLWRFTSEGVFAFDRSDPDLPFAAGRYEVEGETIRFSADGPGCRDTWEWKAGIDEGDTEDPLDDELHIVFAEPGCDRIAGTQWTFGRIAPSE